MERVSVLDAVRYWFNALVAPIWASLSMLTNKLDTIHITNQKTPTAITLIA
jgi:hypothetical protein